MQVNYRVIQSVSEKLHHTHEFAVKFFVEQVKSVLQDFYQNYRFFISSYKIILASFLPVNCNELIVLNSPKSVEFKGSSDLPAEDLSEVFSAALGYSIEVPKTWDGLYVNDPFSVAQSVISIVVEGAEELKFKVRC